MMDNLLRYMLLAATGVLALWLAGCATSEREGWRGSARASGSEAHAYNMARLQAEIDHAQRPLVEFRASPEALQTLAASGQPLELTVANPYLMLSEPVAPWWHRLIPEFRDLAFVGVSVYQTERASSMQRRQLQSSERTTNRLLDKIPDEPIFIETLPE